MAPPSDRAERTSRSAREKKPSRARPCYSPHRQISAICAQTSSPRLSSWAGATRDLSVTKREAARDPSRPRHPSTTQPQNDGWDAERARRDARRRVTATGRAARCEQRVLRRRDHRGPGKNACGANFGVYRILAAHTVGLLEEGLHQDPVLPGENDLPTRIDPFFGPPMGAFQRGRVLRRAANVVRTRGRPSSTDPGASGSRQEDGAARGVGTHCGRERLRIRGGSDATT